MSSFLSTGIPKACCGRPYRCKINGKTARKKNILRTVRRVLSKLRTAPYRTVEVQYRLLRTVEERYRLLHTAAVLYRLLRTAESRYRLPRTAKVRYRFSVP